MLTRRALLKTIPALGFALTVPVAYSSPISTLGEPRTSEDDILNAVRSIVLWGVSQIPEIGSVVATIAGKLWPSSGPDPWDQVRKQVEAMIDRKINDAVFSMMKAKLNGLGNALSLYVCAVQSKDTEMMRTQFVATNTVFVEAAAEFQNRDFEWTLAPLFALFTQIHMTLLRDVVLNGKEWGWNGAYYAKLEQQARDTTDQYVACLDQAVEHERARRAQHAPVSPGGHMTDVYNYWQPFEQQRILLIDDFRTLLVYLDPVRHPGPTTDVPFKDVYSLAYGTADDWDDTCWRWSASGIATPYGQPLATIESIDVELFNATPRVVNVRYPAGQGPKVAGGSRTDQYGIIADPLGGVEKYTVTLPKPAPDKRFNIRKAYVTSGSIPLGLTLELDDGSRKKLWNRTDEGIPATHEVAVPDRMLTTLNMWSRSRFYDNDLGCIVFGFSYDTRYMPPSVKDALYVGAIEQPNTGPSYLPSSISSTLQARRDAFWRDIESRSSQLRR